MAMDVNAVREQLKGVDAKIEDAVRAAEGDGAASVVLTAVVQEFGKKSAKTQKRIGTADATVVWECLVELEQAGDSAKAAVEADPGASDATRQAVLDAHMAICMLKAQPSSS